MESNFEVPSIEVIKFNEVESITTSITDGGGYEQGGNNGETELDF